MKIVVQRGDPEHPDAKRMLVDGNRFYEENYPPESNHLFDIQDLKRPNVRFFIAREGSAVVGIGALVDENSYGELKRMWVDLGRRRSGVGELILEEIECCASALGLGRLRLETGVNQLDAIAFYAKHGFVRIPPFGGYVHDPLSVFMEKRLS